MSNGLLGKMICNSNSVNTPYTVPSTVLFAVANINLVNTGPSDVVVKISSATATTPNTVDYIETGAVIPANGGVLTRYRETFSPGENVMIETSGVGVVVRVSGLEKPVTG